MATTNRTGTIDRKQLIKALGGDTLVARHVEDITNDVIETLPDQAAAALAAANAAQESANDGLQKADGLVLGMLGRRAPAPKTIMQGQLIDIIYDAAGQVVGVDAGQLAAFIAMSAPRQKSAPPADDAQAVIASRMFNRR